MYFIITKRMLEVCFSVHPNIQYRTFLILIRMNFLQFFEYSRTEHILRIQYHLVSLNLITNRTVSMAVGGRQLTASISIIIREVCL